MACAQAMKKLADALPRAVIGSAAARNASGSEWRMTVIAAFPGRTDPQGQNVMSTVASGSAALMFFARTSN
jgi:hypothetical protein